MLTISSLPKTTLHGRLRNALDALIAAAAPYKGLFPSILDRRAGVIPETMPPPIPGQRNGDRAYFFNFCCYGPLGEQ